MLITTDAGNVTASGIERLGRSVGCTRIVAAEHAQDSSAVLPSHSRWRSCPSQLAQTLGGLEQEKLATRWWRRLPENAR